MTRRSIRTLFAAGLATALLASCNDESVAGTSDEAQTSLKLQLVADNLRPIPGEQSEGAPSAGRAVVLEATDSACLVRQIIHEARFEEDEAEGMRWRFRLRDHTRWNCKERYAKVSQVHGRTTETEWWANDTTWMEAGDPVEVNSSAVAVTRTGFRFQYRTRMWPSQPGQAPDQVEVAIILNDLGWEATFRWADDQATTAFAQGAPILQGVVPVGRLAIDTLTGAFRVFDLKGREYLPRPQVFPPVAADSLGVRVVGIRRDTVDGTAGLRVGLVGRLPADSGLSFGGVWLSTFSGPSEALHLKATDHQPWPVGSASASLFFPDLPLDATHFRISGKVVWDRPADSTVHHTGEFLTRILPIP